MISSWLLHATRLAIGSEALIVLSSSEVVVNRIRLIYTGYTKQTQQPSSLQSYHSPFSINESTPRHFSSSAVESLVPLLLCCRFLVNNAFVGIKYLDLNLLFYVNLLSENGQCVLYESVQLQPLLFNLRLLVFNASPGSPAVVSTQLL